MTLPGCKEMGDRYRGVLFSDDERYRYSLHCRFTDDPGRTLLAMLLNPSNATHTDPDRTFDGLCARIKHWNHSAKVPFVQLRIANMYAIRDKDPKILKTDPDPVGVHNDAVIAQEVAGADVILCGWGRHAKPDRISTFVTIVRGAEALHKLVALRTSDDNTPWHPLYQRYAAPLVPWRPALPGTVSQLV